MQVTLASDNRLNKIKWTTERDFSSLITGTESQTMEVSRLKTTYLYWYKVYIKLDKLPSSVLSDADSNKTE